MRTPSNPWPHVRAPRTRVAEPLCRGTPLAPAHQPRAASLATPHPGAASPMLSGSLRAALAVAFTISAAHAQAPIHRLVDGGGTPLSSWPAAAPAGDFDGDGHDDLWASGIAARILSGVDRSIL